MSRMQRRRAGNTLNPVSAASGSSKTIPSCSTRRAWIFRLNYAVDLRYGVLVDLARQIYQGKPVDLSVPAVNVLWQGDANSYAMRALELCQSPARILNVTGPETVQVLRAAEFFAQRFQRPLVIENESKGLALLNNACACHALLGYPKIPLAS